MQQYCFCCFCCYSPPPCDFFLTLKKRKKIIGKKVMRSKISFFKAKCKLVFFFILHCTEKYCTFFLEIYFGMGWVLGIIFLSVMYNVPTGSCTVTDIIYTMLYHNVIMDEIGKYENTDIVSTRKVF